MWLVVERPADSSRAGWLRQRVKSRALDVLRRRRTRAEHEGRLDPAQPPLGPEDVAARLKCHRQVAEAVAALSEPYRTTVFLRYFEDRPPSEIARLLGIPVSTVKTRLERALPQLRERLATRLGQDSDDGHAALCLTFSLPWTASVPTTPLGHAQAAPIAAPIATLGGAGVLMTKKLVALGLTAALVVCVVRFGPSLTRLVTPESSLVVGASGAPVPRADIWVASGRRDWLGGELAATANDQGQFWIRQIGPTTSLGAFAPGYAPSPLVDLELCDTAGGAATIELVLA